MAELVAMNTTTSLNLNMQAVTELFVTYFI